MEDKDQLESGCLVEYLRHFERIHAKKIAFLRVAGDF